MKYEHIQYLLIAYHGKKPKAIYLKLTEYCKSTIVKFFKKKTKRDFPGDTVAKTPHSQCRGPRFDSWSGN